MPGCCGAAMAGKRQLQSALQAGASTATALRAMSRAIVTSFGPNVVVVWEPGEVDVAVTGFAKDAAKARRRMHLISNDADVLDTDADCEVRWACCSVGTIYRTCYHLTSTLFTFVPPRSIAALTGKHSGVSAST